jgi:hypothetical protein
VEGIRVEELDYPQQLGDIDRIVRVLVCRVHRVVAGTKVGVGPRERVGSSIAIARRIARAAGGHCDGHQPSRVRHDFEAIVPITAGEILRCTIRHGEVTEVKAAYTLAEDNAHGNRRTGRRIGGSGRQHNRRRYKVNLVCLASGERRRQHAICRIENAAVGHYIDAQQSFATARADSDNIALVCAAHIED